MRCQGVVMRMGGGSLVIMQRRGWCWCGAELIWCWRGDEECVLGGSCQALGRVAELGRLS